MSIPKVIHYCWFGKAELPKLVQKCIKSWRKYCPDYEIICWNEDTFDISQNRYMQEAYEAKNWAFVSDFVRLKVVYEHGGIYLDTDVELIKPLDALLALPGFMGFDENGLVATGLGFGAEKGNSIVGEFLKDYEDISFVTEDGKVDNTPCPDRNTMALKRMGMDMTNHHQTFRDMVFLPREYLCPKGYYGHQTAFTNNTVSIHHYAASWTSKTSKRTRLVKRIVGEKMYAKLYGKFLHKCKGLEW